MNRLTAERIELYCRAWMPANPQGLIVFIHGAAEHSGHYSRLGEGFRTRRIGIVAPDLRGFGQSGGRRGHIDRFQDYLNDLDRLVIRLQRRYPGLPMFLCGHSLGGLVAVRYMQRFSPQAAGVILSSPALGIRFKMPPFVRKCVEFGSRLFPTLSLEMLKWNETFRRLKPYNPSLPDLSAELLNDPLVTTRYTARWFVELLQNGTAALSEADTFRIPALCLYDQNDPLIDSASVERFFESIRSEDKERIVFANSSHTPLHDDERNEVSERIYQWLSRRL